MLRLIFILLGSFLSAQSVQLLYFTDAHQLYELDDVPGGRGGFARLKTVVDECKKENPSTLTIHGGDFVGGVLYGGMLKGKNMPGVFNQIPVDILNFGQHEFDYGVEHLQQLIPQFTGSFFTTNLVDDNNNSFLHLPTYLLRKIENQTLLFLGLTDQMQTTIQDPRVRQDDIFLSVQRVLSLLSSVAIDKIVVISQMDLEKNTRLVEQFPQIDLVLTEELNEYNSQINFVGKTPIVAPSGNMSAVAKILLSKNSLPSIQLIPLNQEVKKDPKLAIREQQEKDFIDRQLNEKVADLLVDLDVQSGLKGESLAGNLITDAMRFYYDADAAMIDANGIRNAVRNGDFTLKSARTLLPFGNKMVMVSIKVGDLKDFILKNFLLEKPKIMQVSGFSYQYNAKDHTIVFPNLQDDQILRLVLNEYNFKQLQRYENVLISAHDQQSVEDFFTLTQWARKQQRIRPKLEKRITIIKQK
ncbi:bifunctional metallophosphatase/5'-nucleotidase [Vaginella massiliensis]|uniref:bifunctional metallophosphatase/5'-nucleotidase n=1 Tax=Vaginella massiliensis TaxID=1816680 RepID=UPI003751727E